MTHTHPSSGLRCVAARFSGLEASVECTGPCMAFRVSLSLRNIYCPSVLLLPVPCRFDILSNSYAPCECSVPPNQHHVDDFPSHRRQALNPAITCFAGRVTTVDAVNMARSP